jgi:hypothetical protein
METMMKPTTLVRRLAAKTIVGTGMVGLLAVPADAAPSPTISTRAERLARGEIYYGITGTSASQDFYRCVDPSRHVSYVGGVQGLLIEYRINGATLTSASGNLFVGSTVTKLTVQYSFDRVVVRIEPSCIKPGHLATVLTLMTDSLGRTYLVPYLIFSA